MDSIMKFIGDYSLYISLVPLLLFIIVFVFNILRGLIRGFRKSLILMIFSFVEMILAYIIFLAVLRQSFFEGFLLDTIKKTRGESLNSQLDVSESYTRIKTIISAYIQGQIDGADKKAIYETFSPYVESMATAILGLIYMLVTFVVYFVLKIIFFLFLYLPVFREGKYKKKKNKEYYDKMNEGEVSEAPVKKRDKNAGYKKRSGCGALIGVVRGIISGVFAISLFGTIFFIVSGSIKPNLKSNEDVVISVNGEEYDITNLYKFFDEYESINTVAESVKIGKMPVYASLGNLFCNAKVVIKEDGIKTKVYPIKELGAFTNSLHEGILLLDKYDIKIDGKNTLDRITELFNTNESFSDDLYKYINSIGKTKLSKAIGKTISIHFVELCDNAGIKNKYFDSIFKGENAIGINDIASRSDLKVVINVLSKALDLYDKYNDTKDAKDIIINNSKEIADITDELLKLSIFNTDKQDRLNNIISDLLGEALAKVDYLKDISFKDIEWVKNGNAKGEIELFIDALGSLLDSDLVFYENGNLLFDFSNLKNIFDNTNGDSVMDNIKNSKALRSVATKFLENTKIIDNELYITPSAYDASGVIKAESFDTLFKSLKDIVDNANITNNTHLTFKDLKDQILSDVLNNLKNYNELAESLTESDLVCSMFSRVIYDFIVGMGYESYIPEDIKLDEAHFNENISKWNEVLRDLITSIQVLYKCEIISLDGNEFKYDINNVNNLFDGTSNEPIDKILESKVIRGLLTKVIEGVDVGYTIYLPKDVYQDGSIKSSELKGVFKVLNLIVNNGISFNGDNIDGDLAGILTDVCASQDNRNIILSSTIMSGTLSYAVYDTLKDINSVDFSVVVPEDLDLALNTNITNWLGNGNELDKIMKAVALVDFTNITNFDFIFKLTESDFNDLVASEILGASITKTIKEINVADIDIIVLNEALDSRGYVSGSEILAMVNSLKSICGYDDLSSEDKEAFSFDTMVININELIDNKDKIDTIFNSYILMASISYKAYGIINDSVDIPNDLKLPTKNDSNIYKWINVGENKGELYYLVEALRVLELTDKISNTSSSIEINANELINTLVINKTYESIENSINKIVDSKIIYATASKTLIDFNNDSTSMVKIPESAIDNGFVIRAEIVKLFKAIKALGITDIDSVDENSILNNSDIDADVLVESSIMWLTISKAVLSTSEVTIPLDVKETIGTDTYINRAEIKALIRSINLLEITSYASIDSSILIKAIQNMDEILNSMIIWITISDNIIDIASEVNASIKLPSVAYTNESKTTIDKLEIKKLAIAVKELAGESGDIETVDADLILGDNLIDMDKVLDSNIIRYTISDGIDTCGLTITKYAYDDYSATERFVKKDEIKAMISALKAIGATTLDLIVIDDEQFLSFYNDDAKMNALLSSRISWYEISSQFKDKITTIPQEAIEQDTLGVSELYIKQAEIKSLLKALKLFNITTVAGYNVSSSLFQLSEEELLQALDSFIIWNEFTTAMKNSNEIRIYKDAMDLVYSSYISKAEIVSTIVIVKAISNDPNINDITIDPSRIISNDLTSRVSNSAIMQGTITKIIFYENKLDSYRGMRNEYYLYDDINEANELYSFTSAEITALINGLDILGISDMSAGLTFGMEKIILMSSSERESALQSGVIYAYIASLFEGLPVETNLYNVYSYKTNTVTNYEREMIVKSAIISA